MPVVATSPVVAVSMASSDQAARWRKGGPLRVRGARRSGAYDDGFADGGKQRPRRARRFRFAFMIAKIVVAVVVQVALEFAARQAARLIVNGSTCPPPIGGSRRSWSPWSCSWRSSAAGCSC